MSDLTLTKTRIQAGVYEAVLKADVEGNYFPELQAFHLEKPVGELSLSEDAALDKTWLVRLTIPADVLTDGIQSFVIVDTKTEATLDSFTIITGEPLDDDIRAEVDLLRAELDMLKKAFRRHCVETT